MSDIVEDYRLLKELGKGVSGQVYLAEKCKNKDLDDPENSNNLFALKFIQRFYKDRAEEEHVIIMLESEVNAIEIVDSHRVIKSTECFTTEDFFVIVMEYCENGDLNQHVKTQGRLPEFKAVELLAQILQGIQAVHAKNLIHRDIKPENILLDEAMEAKIGDFGAVITYEKEHLLESLCGTFFYMAPEMECFREYDFSVDIWSLACCYFFMLTGKSPFGFCKSQLAISNEVYQYTKSNSFDVESLIRRHVEEGSLPSDVILPESESGTIISKESGDLLASMLRYDPENRISLHDIIHHPLLKKYEKTSTSIQKLIEDNRQLSLRQIPLETLENVPEGLDPFAGISSKKHEFTPMKSTTLIDRSLCKLPSLRQIQSQGQLRSIHAILLEEESNEDSISKYLNFEPSPFRPKKPMKKIDSSFKQSSNIDKNKENGALLIPLVSHSRTQISQFNHENENNNKSHFKNEDINTNNNNNYVNCIFELGNASQNYQEMMTNLTNSYAPNLLDELTGEESVSSKLLHYPTYQNVFLMKNKIGFKSLKAKDCSESVHLEIDTPTTAASRNIHSDQIGENTNKVQRSPNLDWSNVSKQIISS